MIETVILAGGHGSRMNSSKAKVTFTIKGVPMVVRTIGILRACNFSKITVVVGHKAAMVKRTIARYTTGVKFVQQKRIAGTANAFLTFWRTSNKDRHVLCLYGDDSFAYNPTTLTNFVAKHFETRADMSVMVVKPLRNISNYRRVFVDKAGKFAFLTKKPSLRGLVVCGVYVLSPKAANMCHTLVKNTPHGIESGLVDLMYLKDKLSITVVELSNHTEWMGVNTKDELKFARRNFS